MEAWHWISADRMTRYDPRMPVVVGETLRVDGRIELCERGLHASVKAMDALRYAPGPICCRVRLGGTIIHGDDKVVASERTVLWMFDATNVLHEMACISAETALLIANVDDPRCWEAIEAKRAWLRGEIDDAQLDAAWGAARAAAWAAARDDAAWGAAWGAARAAARDDAARAAARDDAAWDAARDATWAAARVAAWAAAWAAARAAARAAAWDEQNTVFEMLLNEAGGK